MGANDSTGIASAIGQPVLRKEDARFLTGTGQFTDDVTMPRQTLRLFPALAACARDDPRDRRAEGEGCAGRGRRLHRRRPDRRQRPAVRLAHHRHRRQADEGAAASGARARQGALRRRCRRAGRRRDDRPGEGRGRADRRRLRGAAGGRQFRRCAETRRAADPRAGARQHVLHVGARRQGGGRRGVRQGRARHEARHRQQPADPQRDRAARGDRVVQPRRRRLHALRREPESARRAAADDGVRARPARAQGARDRARRRRRLRLEDLPVRRRDGDGVGVEARQPPDQVDRRAQRIVPVRRARPRPRHACRARARQGRQVPRAARADDGQHGRVPVDVRVVHPDDPVRDAARRPVHDAGDLLRSDGGVHQHRAGRCLSRRRAARGDLRRRADRPPGGRRNWTSRRTRSAAATSSASFRTRRRSRCNYDIGNYDQTLDAAMRDGRRRGLRRAQGRGASSAASCAASATRPTSRPAASRRRTSPARSARAPACSRPARCACIRPAA